MLNYINQSGVLIHKDLCGVSLSYRLSSDCSLELVYPTLNECLTDLQVNNLDEISFCTLLLFPKDLGFTD
jgi:hypothetical protein